jgi:plastocyanin
MSVLLAAAVVASGVLSAGAAEYTIIIDKMKFGPVPETLHPGDTIVWQNDDMFRHSATAKDKSFDFDLPSKSSVAMVVGQAGSVPFFCKYHPGMMGTLVISQ